MYRRHIASIFLAGLTACGGNEQEGTDASALSDLRGDDAWVDVPWTFRVDDYGNHARAQRQIVHQGAERIRIHFDEFDTEPEYDTLTITGASDQVVLHGQLGSFSVELAGSTAELLLESDDSITEPGFVISHYSYFPAGPEAGGEDWKDKSFLFDKRTYGDNEEETKKIEQPGARRLRILFERFDLENGYDYLSVTDDRGQTARLTGRQSHFDVEGASATLRFTSDGSVHSDKGYGFLIRKFQYFEQTTTPDDGGTSEDRTRPGPVDARLTYGHDGGLFLTGRTEPGATVFAYVMGGAEALRAVRSDPISGAFRSALPGDAGDPVTVYAADATGNVGPSHVLRWWPDRDETPPRKLANLQVEMERRSVRVSGREFRPLAYDSSAVPWADRPSAEPGAEIVAINTRSGLEVRAAASDRGAFDIRIDARSGDVVQLFQEDVAGHRSPGVSFLAEGDGPDHHAPGTPQGVRLSYGREGHLFITGTAEPRSTVYAYVKGATEALRRIDTDDVLGQFRSEVPGYAGDRVIVYAVDAAGNIGPSDLFVWQPERDTHAPKRIHNYEAKFGDGVVRIVGAGFAPDAYDSEVPSARAAAEPGATVFAVNGRSGEEVRAAADAFGGFELVLPVRLGDPVRLFQVDAAGNASPAVALRSGR